MGKKLTIEEMQSIAESKNGKCLSDTYVNSHSKLQWRCSEGHEWWAEPSGIKNNNTWCPECSKIRVGKINTKRNKEGILTIEEMQDIAISRGGKCLSDTYVNNRTKLLWRCKEGHIFLMKSNAVKNGQWCPKCAGRYRYTLNDVIRKINEKGGKYISGKHNNGRSKILVECSNGHQWFTSMEKMNCGYWCPHCVGNVKLTIDDMHKTAESRGGKCLSTEYIGIEGKLQWQCKEGHIWVGTPHDIRSAGSWCPECGKKESIRKRMKYNIKNIKSIAESRGGKCLSHEYINDKKYLLWECSKKHQWKASVNSVIYNGSWCSYCSIYKTENKCRKIFESIFNKPFNKARPDWLINPKTGRKLELDGYNKEEKIAFEYNGYQHYVYPNSFSKTKREFLYTKYRDRIKKKICKRVGVKLIIIPYRIKDFEIYIKKKLGVTN